jgi:hypothetical protein
MFLKGGWNVQATGTTNFIPLPSQLNSCASKDPHVVHYLNSARLVLDFVLMICTTLPEYQDKCSEQL